MESAWIIFVFLAAIIASAASIVQKKTLVRQHAMEFSAVLALFAMIITLPLFFLAEPSSLSLKAIYLIYGASFFGSIASRITVKEPVSNPDSVVLKPLK